MSKKKVRIKHVPQRTCVGCREINPKRSLTRVVRTQEGIVIDPTGKLSGRGAYLHNNKGCWERGLRGSLEKALKTTFEVRDRENLIEFMQTLRDEEPLEESLDAASL